MTAIRKIIHVDMDAFFASVEQRDFPELRGKPVVVGGRPESRGAVAAASYEARTFGIHSALPSRIATQRCPHLIFITPRMAVYKEISQQIRDIFLSYTEWVEPVAFDEAYLDVTGATSAMAIARQIKQDIFNTTQLTASAGVAVNKFLAKMASGQQKPDGLTLIPPDQGKAFVQTLPIEKFHGVGKVTAKKMKAMGIQTGADLLKLSEDNLVKKFGKVGRYYYAIARGEDERPVNPNRVRKSIGAERSFYPDLSDFDAMESALKQLAQAVERRLKTAKKIGYTVTLKVKYDDYQQVTRAKPSSRAVMVAAEIDAIVLGLFVETIDRDRKVRLLGITISGLRDTGDRLEQQLELDFGG